MISRFTIAAVAFGLCTASQAVTFRGVSDNCENLAAVTVNVVGMRDAGVPWERFEPWMRESLAEALNNPDSYVKDADDVYYIMKTFKHVYDSPKLGDEQAAKDVLQECMVKQVKGGGGKSFGKAKKTT